MPRPEVEQMLQDGHDKSAAYMNSRSLKIEVKSVKYAAFASKETMCFQAAVYIDGVKVGNASNDGHGGMTMIHPYTLASRLNEYGKTLPKKPYGHGIDGEYEQSADSIVDDLVADWLVERDVKRMLTGKIVFTKKGAKGIWSLNVPKVTLAARLADPTLPSKLKDCDKVLNLLPLAEAIAIYRREAA